VGFGNIQLVSISVGHALFRFGGRNFSFLLFLASHGAGDFGTVIVNIINLCVLNRETDAQQKQAKVVGAMMGIAFGQDPEEYEGVQGVEGAPQRPGHIN